MSVGFKTKEIIYDGTPVFPALSVLERVEKTIGRPLPDLTQTAYIVQRIGDEDSLNGSTLSPLAVAGSLRRESWEEENAGDELYFVEFPAASESITFRFRVASFCFSS